jgi:hypothetical protein
LVSKKERDAGESVWKLPALMRVDGGGFCKSRKKSRAERRIWRALKV